MESDAFDLLTIMLMRIDPTLGLIGAWQLRHDVSLDLVSTWIEMNRPPDQDERPSKPNADVRADANGVKTYEINSLDQLIGVFGTGRPPQ